MEKSVPVDSAPEQPVSPCHDNANRTGGECGKN